MSRCSSCIDKGRVVKGGKSKDGSIAQKDQRKTVAVANLAKISIGDLKLALSCSQCAADNFESVGYKCTNVYLPEIHSLLGHSTEEKVNTNNFDEEPFQEMAERLTAQLNGFCPTARLPEDSFTVADTMAFMKKIACCASFSFILIQKMYHLHTSL